MQNLKQAFSPERHCAVIFVECDRSPEDFISTLQSNFKNSSFKQGLVVCTYNLSQPWHGHPQTLEIVYLLIQKQGHLTIERISVHSKQDLFLKKSGLNYLLDNNTITVNINLSFYLEMKNEFNRQNIESERFSFSPNEPLFMEPVYIPKPWGQEIWYTGVEKRGVSEVSSLHSKLHIPLPWFFASLSSTLLGEKYRDKNLVLIKILDPLPQEVYGDLYYELHQEKNEVYVVTDISSNIGQIKMGINPHKLAQYKNNIPQLKQEFLEAIEKYEIVRREIDSLCDACHEPDKIPQELKAKEQALRKNMDEFAGYLNLKVGDVISVPILVPHALQHGVRVIEFQTPTYERLIISFAQKVLTQAHWDSKLALDLMEVQGPQKSELKQLSQNESYLLELVCAFQDFYAVRVTLNATRKYQLKNLPFYQILFLVKGDAKLQMGGINYQLQAGKCVFIPALSSVQLQSENELTFLICAPEKF